jgi:ABC-type uncharacterized transport system YnjBCD ATPase subunit
VQTAACTRIRTVWLLGRQKAAATRLVCASAGEALGEILRQDPRIFLHQPMAANHLAALAKLTKSANNRRLSLSQDALDDSSIMDAMLGGDPGGQV